ncbi:multidrug efflux RND transporter permease subunit [Coraliomargarita algicola]|uniref:Multidrug efflux RND transporter permease subunit n=1 Tax=Coraliomargarita algicola TaxID=3092156 RepID=A0ABZ0RE43_9BACT|nr:multidrug efflux RND transporter permease subunit [Coraliomargarita sp. J2-16]WPJ94425.1 multidrug efflux RND transporter permease subunit [Coraliomargarita sp. J2-16]
MNFSHFFIKRPRFAIVISIVFTVLGILAFPTLPIAQYPEVAPPTVVVRASYAGATPETIANTVAAPIEQEINGVENMLYMSSNSTADGSLAITVTFELGTDLDQAQVLVQNRVAIAEPRLPEEVRSAGVTVTKNTPDILLVVQMMSPGGTYDNLYVSNYAITQVREQLRRIQGVGDVRLFGAREYSMRIWLNPEKLSSLSMIPSDVVAALREQNVQVAAGVIGQSPTSQGNAFQYNVSTLGRLDNETAFEDIVVKTGQNGEVVHLRDVARVELGAQDYGIVNYATKTPALAMPIFQRPGSNALETASAIRATMAELEKDFPDDLEYKIIYDPTQFIQQSIDEVQITLLQAILFVVLVIVIFLQSWRAAIIPFLAIPISLIGTFATMAIMGFSLNNLTLFGLVLAIGIVVDDAIVVVENIQRNIDEGKSPREAAFAAMSEVTGAVIATSLVMVAIFVPTAYIPGISGQFYQQFALTISGAVVISTIVSLSLSPALGAILLRPSNAPQDRFTRIYMFLFGWFFKGFNWFFDKFTRGYTGIIRRIVRFGFAAIIIYVGLLAVTWFGFGKVPVGFIPTQDQGYSIVVAQLPDGSSLQRTDELTRSIVDTIMTVDGIKGTVAFAGFNGASFTNSPNSAAIFTPFESFEERLESGRDSDTIIAELRQKLGGIQEAFVFVIPPPPVRGIGSGGGFKMQLRDRAGLGPAVLEQTAWKLAMAANAEPSITQTFTSYRSSVPQYYADVNRVKAKMLDVPLNNIFSTMQIYLGSLYVNDINLLGRTYRVTAQADTEFRDTPEDLYSLKTRNNNGDIVPLASLVELKNSSGPDRYVRYNLFSSAEVQGSTTPGYSSGDSIATMERLAAEILPPGMDYEWTDLAYQQKQAGGSTVVFLMAIAFVFLVLVAQYENWSLPLAIILIVPLSLSGAIGLVALRGFDNNILTQIGFIVLIGLAAKNAILIVEFAKQKQDEGMNRFDAAIEASRLRLRPILMTAIAFILGVVPLVFATGAGAEMRQALGTAVFGGMLGVTAIGIFMTPVFYVIIQKYAKSSHKASN